MMEDYDVIVIGGGINGLTCAAYLGKAGLKTLVLEARGECGAHCDTNEPGIPGFLHNLHATWLISAMSPAMGDLELSKFGLEYRTTDFIYGKTFADGKNALLGVDPMNTILNWQKHSAKDAEMIIKAGEFLLTRLPDITKMLHEFLYEAPCLKTKENMGRLYDEFNQKIGVHASFKEIWNMNGFKATDIIFESEYIKTLILSLSWIGGLPPIHPTVGSVGTAVLGPLTGPIYPVHQAKGGSHALTHAIVKAATTHGVKILPCCPVKQIRIENGKAIGVVLSDEAIFANETISAKKIVSNLTVIPTFLDLIGEDYIGAEMAGKINKFDYNEQNLIGVYYALYHAPQFASADFDDGIQKCFMGYFGGDDAKALERFNTDLISKKIHKEIMANWFVPSLADPTQAPPGCHTAFAWLDTPPAPVSWKNGPLKGLSSWDDIKQEMADQITDTFEKYAPGFKKSVKDRIIYTPLDMQRNNTSAILGNWVGGSVIPGQFFDNRPVPGVLKGGGSRTFIENLYLSNSIHPFGATWLASGYIAANEIAEDMGVREQSWWKHRACDWYLANMAQIPTNLGVR
ncbi:MAG: NAD(P)/FAD-dependent oxidoreductase [Proteobacteria bacterium]|nr:NAD(P)/FAD-dependent oxidoreductase [Pseudomonadota bacterium]